MYARTVQDRAMLVGLHIGRWGAVMTDKAAARKTAQDYGADPSMVRNHIDLVMRDAFKEMDSIQSKARGHHEDLTLPWSRNGDRILAADRLFDYKAVMRQDKDEWDPIVEQFLQEYPRLYNDAPAHLGGLYNAKKYPRPDQLPRRFYFDIDVNPVPYAPDFRCDLSEAVEGEIREYLHNDISARLLRGTAERLMGPVQRMAERLRAYDDTGDKKTGVFRDTLVSNLKDVLAVVPRGDPDTDSLLAAIETQLCYFEPKELRNNAAVREHVATDADALLARILEFMG